VENAVAFGQVVDRANKLTEEKLYLEDEIRAAHNFEEIIGESAGLKRILEQIRIGAPTDSTILIQGETGTGKELIARAIHNLSSRREHTLVKVNCAAIPMGLLESELFGHEKGAFTGAITQRIGRFELAHRGTIFLDEVGDIPLELQPKLLRVLQEQEFERLGSARTIRVDVRVVAATNADLAQKVTENQFRNDLYYRLNVFPVTIPPLRERRTDIPLLVRHFAQKYARRMKKPIETIPTAAMSALMDYRWPGNVRELENLVRRLAALYPQDTITGAIIDAELDSRPLGNGAQPAVAKASAQALAEADGLSDAVERHLADYFAGFKDGLPPPGLYHRILREIEGPLIGAALAATRGNQIRAAELLGVNRNTLRKKVRDLDLQVIRTGR
jgi:two-component system, NtrC family, nitrogen regulation response regulator GlnG